MTGGIGPPVASYPQAPHSLQAVRASRSLAQAMGDDGGGLTDSEDYVVERLAVEHLGTGTVDLLVQELIGNLVEYDRRRGTQLLETLEQWLRSGCNTAETARALFLERQSMHSRLTRIFELIGGTLGGPRGWRAWPWPPAWPATPRSRRRTGRRNSLPAGGVRVRSCAPRPRAVGRPPRTRPCRRPRGG